MKNIFILGMLFLAVASFAIAAEKNDTNETGKQAERNMTYGQCVSQAAEEKNSCYGLVKDARASCVEAANNASGDTKACKADYKKDMRQCKANFKDAKKDCVKSYKPGFFEKMKSSMK